VEPIFLFDLASQQARWLATRQAKIAENVSNANTPGFKASDVAPFEEVFSDASLRMAATNPGHLGLDPLASDAVAVKESNAWEVTHSGNSVSLEKEMIKAGEVNRTYSLNTSVVKAFNQMLMASVKG
jgi:flagellar basal-body rod protein FlgB